MAQKPGLAEPFSNLDQVVKIEGELARLFSLMALGLRSCHAPEVITALKADNNDLGLCAAWPDPVQSGDNSPLATMFEKINRNRQVFTPAFIAFVRAAEHQNSPHKAFDLCSNYPDLCLTQPKGVRGEVDFAILLGLLLKNTGRAPNVKDCLVVVRDTFQSWNDCRWLAAIQELLNLSCDWAKVLHDGTEWDKFSTEFGKLPLKPFLKLIASKSFSHQNFADTLIKYGNIQRHQ